MLNRGGFGVGSCGGLGRAFLDSSWFHHSYFGFRFGNGLSSGGRRKADRTAIAFLRNGVRAGGFRNGGL